MFLQGRRLLLIMLERTSPPKEIIRFCSELISIKFTLTLCAYTNIHMERINEVCYRMERQKLHSREDCALRNLKDKHTYTEECRRESRRRWIHKIFHLRPTPWAREFLFHFHRSCRRTYEGFTSALFLLLVFKAQQMCVF